MNLVENNITIKKKKKSLNNSVFAGDLSGLSIHRIGML